MSNKPTHELFYLESYTDRNGQPKKKRVVMAKGWKNQDKFNDNADYYTFNFIANYCCAEFSVLKSQVAVISSSLNKMFISSSS